MKNQFSAGTGETGAGRDHIAGSASTAAITGLTRLMLGMAWRLLLFATAMTVLTAPNATAAGNEVVQTPSIFAPAATPAHVTRELTWIVLVITGTIFLVVAGLTVYAIMRFRRRQGDDGREPPQVYGSLQIELAWTVVPILIVVVLFLVTARYIFAIEGRPPGPEALEVTIVGHQWWWEIRYPKLGIVTANELHVPVSDPAHPTPTFITLQSADVIHSFWIPQLAGKMDVIPNKTNRIWIDPHEPGGYVGQCAEYCGLQHAGMLLIVAVQSKEDFAKWAAQQRAPARNDAEVQAGRELFSSLSCINCHAVRGTAANGLFGPDLTHLMSRRTIGAGVIQNTPENIRSWIDDPASLKPGALMPAMKLSREDLDKVTAYLLALR